MRTAEKKKQNAKYHNEADDASNDFRVQWFPSSGGPEKQDDRT
jgi:hypothetical protein